MRPILMSVLALSLALTTGCERATWTRADVFSTTEAARSQRVVDATIESVAFLGGVQRGLNINLDESVQTDQGSTKRIYLEQPVQLPLGITFMKRVRVHFDHADSPLYVEEIKPPTP
ncbi:MAG TPA: hypothetical protein VHX44_02435 [Planctomycetota bacterium]|nr:hypothetical protein [Planctomycetota bacterium]